MITIEMLPAINATLNATSAMFLMAGFYFIRKRNIRVHRRFMLAACTASVLFLVSYLTYHFNVVGVTKFTGTGWTRPVYFSILISHTILAVVVLPLAIWSVVNGLRMRVQQHRRVAIWTFPVWLYVSITGVLVYLFLYQLFPST